MDSKIFRLHRSKITQTAPAIFADNMMKLITEKYNIPWNLTFTTEEWYDEFFLYNGCDITGDVENAVYAIDLACPEMWLDNEEAFSKLLYKLKMEFYEKPDGVLETEFLLHCALMVYFAVIYYKKGVTSALNIAFRELYFRACYYSERRNFKCDLRTTSTEF